MSVVFKLTDNAMVNLMSIPCVNINQVADILELFNPMDVSPMEDYDYMEEASTFADKVANEGLDVYTALRISLEEGFTKEAVLSTNPGNMALIEMHLSRAISH